MGGFATGIIHEGEYVLYPIRSPLPISTSSKSATPSRLDLPGLTRTVKQAEEAKLHEKPQSPTLEATSADCKQEILPMVHRWSHTHSILSVVAAPTKGLVLCGTQDSKILIFDVSTFTLKHVINCGHSLFAASVLCLALSPDENVLFSAGSDSLVKVWDLTPFADSSVSDVDIRCTHLIYSLVDIGDIFSLAWLQELSTLFIGAQNASILWCKLNLKTNLNAHSHVSSVDRLPHFRFDKFFDSKGPGGSMNRVQSEHALLRTSRSDEDVKGPILVEIKSSHNLRFAHNGYVYCMDLLRDTNSYEFCALHADKGYTMYLVTCGGDGVIIVWGISQDDDGNILLEEASRLENDDAILSMHVCDSSIYVGLSNSSINAWDLTTSQLTRSFHFISETDKHDEILSLCIYNDYIYKATNNGGLCKFPLKHDLHGDEDIDDVKSTSTLVDLDFSHLLKQQSVNIENDSVFAVHTFQLRDSTYLLSGGAGSLCLWNITHVGGNSMHSNEPETRAGICAQESLRVSNDDMLESLKTLISYRTISKYPGLYLEESRHCARFLSKLFMALGAAETKLLPVPNCNPVVYAKFKKNHKSLGVQKASRVLWYGHYDVVEAMQDKECWDTDPFSLTAKDGNLHARGVSDNKGPNLAAIYAVAELYRNEELSTDVIFLIEGEEECGSIGFQDVVEKYKQMIGPIDWIMLSNSYWLGDDIPCLNYGLRGVLNASVVVQSEKPDRHSGVDGGVSREPIMDLIHVLGQLMCSETKRIRIPEFYDDVLPVDDAELKLYEKIKDTAGKTDCALDVDSLLDKWRNPSLTVHRIDVSGPKNNTVISQISKASLSIRVVPNQELTKIKLLLVAFLHETFASLKTENHLSVDIFHEAEPWLGDPTNLVYMVLWKMMKKNWGPSVADPLFIREGGSIPSIRFLEKAFNAPAAQIPCGQASDSAHLKNEKLRILNLFKLRSILHDTFQVLGLQQGA